MAKKFILPDAYKCEGPEVVGGHVFKDGELIVSDDDAKLMEPKLKNFYGVTVEDVVSNSSDEDDDSGEGSLAADKTKA